MIQREVLYRAMEPIRLIVTSGFSEPVLAKELPDHRIRIQMDRLERLLSDMSEERMLGLY